MRLITKPNLDYHIARLLLECFEIQTLYLLEIHPFGDTADSRALKLQHDGFVNLLLQCGIPNVSTSTSLSIPNIYFHFFEENQHR